MLDVLRPRAGTVHVPGGGTGPPPREMTLLVTHFGTSRRVVDTLNTLNIIRKVAAAMRPLTTRQVAIHLLLLKPIA